MQTLDQFIGMENIKELEVINTKIDYLIIHKRTNTKKYKELCRSHKKLINEIDYGDSKYKRIR